MRRAWLVSLQQSKCPRGTSALAAGVARLGGVAALAFLAGCCSPAGMACAVVAAALAWFCRQGLGTGFSSQGICNDAGLLCACCCPGQLPLNGLRVVGRGWLALHRLAQLLLLPMPGPAVSTKG